MSRSWNSLPQKNDDLIKRLLLNRGIRSEKEAEKFFHPKLSDYDHELKVPGLEKAVHRVKQAIDQGELIIIYGDYDADGVCGTAIAYLGLSTAGAKVLPYIPHRLKEGYGLSKQGLDFAKERGASLVLTVDNGIVAYEAAQYATSLGLDLIITDHHQPLQKLPKVQALVHTPKICGAAIAWCLMREFIKEGEALSLLDLVGIATVADLMPLSGVNRCLAKLGLKELNRTERVGLVSLLAEAGVRKGEITPYHVNFIISPRLNAMGRLEHAIDSLRLLCTKNASSAQKLARILSETNTRRQQQTVEMMIQAKEMVPIPPSQNGGKLVLVHSPNWSAGIIGLVAGKLCEEYRLPAIVISEDKVYSKGSARSIGGVDIIEAIRKCADLLIDVGGHPQAAGFTMETDKIEVFKTRIKMVMDEVVVEKRETLEIEAMVDPGQINLRLAEKLSQFEPHGIGNPKPILASLGMKISGVKTVGADGQHLKFLADGLEAIAFGQAEVGKEMLFYDQVDLAYNIEVNRFNGHIIPQLKVVDIRFPQ